MFFKKKSNSLKSVASGTLISLDKVNDDVSSSKMLGEGYAVTNHNGQIFAPFAAKIDSVFPTKHAITLSNKEGETILIHMGIDTVELKGKPFSLTITVGESVKQGQLLATMDLTQLESSKKDATVIVVVPENTTGKIISDKLAVSIEDTVFSFK